MLPLALVALTAFVPQSPGVKYRQPQATADGDKLGVTFGAGNTIYYSSAGVEDLKFSKLSSIDTKGKLMLGRHRGPRLVYQSNHVIISAIVGQKGGGADGDLLVWRSPDNGASWLKPVRVNDVPNSAREGLHATAAGNGLVVAVWLDQRAKGTRLYGSRSIDGGATWEKNFLVYESPDGTICECCHPTVVIGPGGRIHVMWRNALGGNRDMYVVTSVDGAKTWELPVKLGKESWALKACPMDGGGLAVVGDGKLYSVWRRDNKVYVASTTGKESELGEGKDPAIASGFDGALYAVWSAADGLKARTTKNDTIMNLAPQGEYPGVVFTAKGVLAFYEAGDGISVTRVD
jgi:hypothetical protein